ncbi:sigma-70 family RNA polymerase sigma factor [soil metagenome]
MRAAAGDVAAFERLYRDHAARVHGLARRMVGIEEADELTQDVFVRAWEKLGTFRGEAAFGTWLHRLAVNALLGHRKARGRLRERLEYDQEAVERTATKPLDVTVSVDLEAAMERLPDGARRVFVLHDVEGYRHEEIGKMLGVTVGTSKSLHRARMLLRERLAR